jgi:glutamyl-tRNA synthetase
MDAMRFLFLCRKSPCYTNAPPQRHAALRLTPRAASGFSDMSQSVVTRFAPSPTGYLHIGGARTALFNWLLARQTGGKMLLRIEDTDRERSTEGAIAAIIDGMKWLGLDWDGETIYQFARAERHREVAAQMFSSGAAYKCYATPAELDEMRDLARKEGRPPRYDGRWRELGGTEAEAKAIAEGRKPVIRLKAPREGETVVEDKVQGKVTFPNKDLDDLVLLRSDGNPTYMLAVVVDDHDMGVTQIIRGDDHLTNAARQTHIYQAMGWDVPWTPIGRWATCPRPCVIISRGSAGARATANSSRRRNWSSPFRSSRSTVPRRASTM